MKKQAATIIAVCVGVIAISVPIIVSVELARRQSIDDELNRASTYAEGILRRADATSDDLRRINDKLTSEHLDAPCSPSAIFAMRAQDLSSSHLQMVGYIRNDRLECSSYGMHMGGIYVGPVDFVTSGSAAVRVNREVPIGANGRFLIVSSATGFAAIIHPDVLTDRDSENAAVSGLFAYSNGKLFVPRASYDPEWRLLVTNRVHYEFYDGHRVVALRRSLHGDYVAYATISGSSVDLQVQRVAMTMVPIGVLMGFALAFAVALLARQQLSLPSTIRSALRRREFNLVYQPIVDLETGACCGAEALIRWHRRNGEHYEPDHFIPAAEAHGLMPQLTSYVIRLALHECAVMLRQNPEFHLAINLAATDLESSDVVDLLREACEEHRVSPRSVFVEATERGLLNTEKARTTVRALRELGVRVALDDFGTGYSSLSYLHTLELDVLKIDKSFVEAIGTEAATSGVIDHIISMAKSLNIEMIAEGVETREQAEFLKSKGVQQAQGWFYSKAVPFRDFQSAAPSLAAVSTKSAP